MSSKKVFDVFLDYRKKAYLSYFESANLDSRKTALDIWDNNDIVYTLFCLQEERAERGLVFDVFKQPFDITCREGQEHGTRLIVDFELFGRLREVHSCHTIEFSGGIIYLQGTFIYDQYRAKELDFFAQYKPTKCPFRYLVNDPYYSNSKEEAITAFDQEFAKAFRDTLSLNCVNLANLDSRNLSYVSEITLVGRGDFA